MKDSKIRWGLLGAGAILDRWMKGAVQLDDMEIAAVASRSMETAEKMRERFSLPEAMLYDELLKRDDIDVVYIPVPHTAHKELAMKAMRAGKAVLVEKPGAVCADDFREMVECAKEENVFLMEAVWTRFFPIIPRIKAMLGDEGTGEVRSLHSAFSFRVGDDYQGRLLDPATAGGSLLDVGVYDLHFADMILDKAPVGMTGFASFDSDELHLQVDEQASFIFQYDRGELAVMTSGVRTDMPDTAWIYGTRGYIRIPQFWKPSQFELVRDGESRLVSCPVSQKVEGIQDEGYQYEIAHVNDCLRKGLKESPVMTWEKSLKILGECDELRRLWNYRYPFEQ